MDQRDQLITLHQAGVLSDDEFQAAMDRLPKVCEEEIPPIPFPGTAAAKEGPGPPEEATSPEAAAAHPDGSTSPAESGAPPDDVTAGDVAAEHKTLRDHDREEMADEVASSASTDAGHQPPTGSQWPAIHPAGGSAPWSSEAGPAGTAAPPSSGPAPGLSNPTGPHLHPGGEQPFTAPQLPPQVGRAGQVVAALGRKVFNDTLMPLWKAAAVPIAAMTACASLLAGVIYVLADTPVGFPPLFRILYYTATGFVPLLTHSAFGASGTVTTFSESASGSVSVSYPANLPTVILLALFAVTLQRANQTLPSIDSLRTAALRVVQAAGSFAVIVAGLALLNRGTVVFGDPSSDDFASVTVGARPGSALLWAFVLAGIVATGVIGAALAPRLRGMQLAPIVREGLAAFRGAATTGLLLLGIAVLATAVMFFIGLTDEPAGVAVAMAILYSPMIVYVLATGATGVSYAVDGSGLFGTSDFGLGTFSVGLFDQAVITANGGEVPAAVWLLFVAAMSTFAIGGLAATWTAQRLGVRANRAGPAVGVALALAWMPLGLIFTTSARAQLDVLVNSSFGIFGDLFDPGSNAALGQLANGVTLSAGMDLGLLFVIFTFLGGSFGYVGSLLAQPLRTRVPDPLYRLLGGAQITAAEVAAGAGFAPTTAIRVATSDQQHASPPPAGDPETASPSHDYSPSSYNGVGASPGQDQIGYPPEVDDDWPVSPPVQPAQPQPPVMHGQGGSSPDGVPSLDGSVAPSGGWEGAASMPEEESFELRLRRLVRSFESGAIDRATFERAKARLFGGIE